MLYDFLSSVCSESDITLKIHDKACPMIESVIEAYKYKCGLNMKYFREMFPIKDTKESYIIQE